SWPTGRGNRPPGEGGPKGRARGERIGQQSAPRGGAAAEGGDPMSLLDLASPKRIHVVGVGGAGMSAIATVLARMGHVVSGSDLKASAGLERLRALGVHVTVGHDAANVGDIDAVTTSTASAQTNTELQA